MAFKLEQGLESLKSSYTFVSFLEIMSFVCYALILKESIWFSILGILHPIRGFVGFFLAMSVPTPQFILTKIKFA
jgi:hypothetical protein